MSAVLADPPPDLRALRQEFAEMRATYPRRSSEVREAFERLFRAAACAGQPLDALRQHSTDEAERFFSRTIPGVDGHVYWDGAKGGFVRNDGKTRSPRRWWWAHSRGAELGQYEDLVPVCGEKSCINPEHCQVGRGLRRYRFTTDQMLGALNVVALRLGRAPKAQEWEALGGRPTRWIYTQRFGSWSDALRAAGLTPAPPVHPPASDGDCIASLRHVRGLVGRWPTPGDFDRARASLHEAGLPASRTTIRRALGDWPTAIARASRR